MGPLEPGRQCGVSPAQMLICIREGFDSALLGYHHRTPSSGQSDHFPSSPISLSFLMKVFINLNLNGEIGVIAI